MCRQRRAGRGVNWKRESDLACESDLPCQTLTESAAAPGLSSLILSISQWPYQGWKAPKAQSNALLFALPPLHFRWPRWPLCLIWHSCRCPALNILLARRRPGMQGSPCCSLRGPAGSRGDRWRNMEGWQTSLTYSSAFHVLMTVPRTGQTETLCQIREGRIGSIVADVMVSRLGAQMPACLHPGLKLVAHT